MLNNWLRGKLREFVSSLVTDQFALKLVGAFFTILRTLADLTPTTSDNDVVTRWEAQKIEIAAKLKQQVLDWILPLLTTTKMAAAPATKVSFAELDSEMDSVTREVCGKVSV